MQRIPVSSSNLAAVGYDDAGRVLEVEFNNGAVYQYKQVPRAIFDDLITTANTGGSVGQYFNQHVKKAGFTYVQIR